MKEPNHSWIPYLKMRVMGAIDMASGRSIQARIQTVSQKAFTDEEGHPHRFTWRTIQTWYSLYKRHGVEAFKPREGSDKGTSRVISAEDGVFLTAQIQEAPELPLREIYRRLLCRKHQPAKVPSFKAVSHYLCNRGFNRAARKRLREAKLR